MKLRLQDFDAVTFDVYGTLIDWEPAIISFLTEWAHCSRIDVPGQQLLMAFDRARAEIQQERPAHIYPEVLQRCFDRISNEFNVPIDAGRRAKFARAAHEWLPYEDSHTGLKALQTHVQVGALSNIDEASLASSCKHLAFKFDLVVTAERVGAYKPDTPHFTTAIAELAAMGIERRRILHVGQSLRADITPANTHGLACAWINRTGRSLGLTGYGAQKAKPDLTVSSLAELITSLTMEDQ
jgi:putative hydrolase of the HAD superfamily